MNALIEEKLKDLEESAARIRSLENAVNITQEVLPDAYIWLDYEVNVSWHVKSRDEVGEILREFAKKGIWLGEYNKSDTNPAWELICGEKTIRLQPTWPREGEEGATCRLMKVGETVVTNPIYKLVCDKEA